MLGWVPQNHLLPVTKNGWATLVVKWEEIVAWETFVPWITMCWMLLGAQFFPKEILVGTTEFLQYFLRCRFPKMMLSVNRERAHFIYLSMEVRTLERGGLMG
jgi:hypothetical protein